MSQQTPNIKPPPKRSNRPTKRTTFTSEQVTLLELEFAKNEYICKDRRGELAQVIDLTECQVKTWFQNRRTKKRRTRNSISADQFSCGGNTDADGVCFSPGDQGCKKGTDCVMGGTVGFCCNKAIQDEWNKEHTPQCLKGKIVQFKQWFGMTPLIGRNCSHKFCPSGSTCVQKKWTAHCCE
uniref:Homeobox domain-containing protein n=1 Tax=Caenorhabditis tropicalis TaxID=1561998 RepID=A0A1I7UQ28_9PELO